MRTRKPVQTPEAAIPDHWPHTGPRRTDRLQEPPSLETQKLSTTKASVLGHPKSTPTWAITQLTSVQPQGPVSSPPRGKVNSSGRGTGQPGTGGL